MKDKKFIYFKIGFFVLIMTFTMLVLFTDISSYIVKLAASVLFVLCGLYNFLYAKKNLKNFNFKYAMLLMLGLTFAMLGDILIIDFFAIGAGLFAIGHIFFVIAFINLNKINYKDIIIWLSIFAVCVVILTAFDIYNYNGMFIVVIVYAFVISFMLAKAISNFVFCKNYNKQSLGLILLGASLFFFSDVMLLFNAFSIYSGKLFSILCLTTYYPAEFILAMSIAFLPLINTKKHTL